METNKTELIGKKIYRVSHYGIDRLVGKIERVTKTAAIIGYDKFRLSNFSLIGASSFTLYDYKLETDELNEKYEKKQLIEKIKFKLSEYNHEDKLSLESVKEAVKLLIV